MRLGYNPHKDEQHADSGFVHQVIIPVYIPEQSGYFKDSRQILEFCMESLFRTTHAKTYISVVNNGSCADVVRYLDELLAHKKIHDLTHSTNIGKGNAVLKGLTGHDFKFVTIADSDVMFLNGWQDETYKVFSHFPKAGAVCPTPSPKSWRTYTFNILFELLFSAKLRFTKTKNPEALRHFAKSIGNDGFYNKCHLEKILTVSDAGFRAVVGAGHFLVTYKGYVFENVTAKYNKYKLGGDSEKELLDIPVIKKGLWRLSTEDNFAYHMGNVLESWMENTLKTIVPQSDGFSGEVNSKTRRQSKIIFFMKNRLFAKILRHKTVTKWFLMRKGLSESAAKNY